MKTRILCLSLLLALCAFGQIYGPSVYYTSTSPSGACWNGSPNWQNYLTGVQSACVNTVWTVVATSGSPTVYPDPGVAVSTGSSWTTSLTASTLVRGAAALDTAGYIPYVGSVGTVAIDKAAAGQFFWDATNHRLGLGTVTPARRLDLSSAAGGMTFGDDITTSSERGIYWSAGTGVGGYGIFRPAGSWNGAFQQLNIAWATGVVIDPGNASSASYIQIPRGGINIGTASAPPANGLQVSGNAIVGQLQVNPVTADPGCTTTAHIGKIWFDNTTTTTVIKACLNVAGTMTWVAK
jgi:hypothetical protein